MIFSISFCRNQKYFFRSMDIVIYLESVLYFLLEKIKRNFNFILIYVWNYIFPIGEWSYLTYFYFNKLDIIISNFKYSNVAKSPVTLGKLTWSIFLMIFLFHRTTLLNSAFKNTFLWFSVRTDVLQFEYFLSFRYFHTKYVCGCLRSGLIPFICECLSQNVSNSSKKFIFNACFSLLELFWTFTENLLGHSNVPLWQHFFCAIYFCSIMLILHLYHFM